jgi:hypothetical protein
MGLRGVGLAVLAAALAAGLALPRSAAAEGNSAEAEKLIRHGIELRKAHDDEGAAREFQKAYDEVHTPRAAGQLGLAEQALGRWEDAERHVREALQASDDPWAAKNHAILADALGIIQGHLGRVEINGDPEGAEVSINGHPAGKLPLPGAIPVSAGEVDVELRAPGYQPAQRTLTIVAGQYQRLVLHLAKEAVASEGNPDRTKTPAGEAGGTAGPIVPIQTNGPSSSEPPSTTRVALKWGAVGLAAAGLVVGVTSTILYFHNVSAFQAVKIGADGTCADKNGTGVLQGMGTPESACQGPLNAYRLDSTLAIVGYVGAGVFAATWLVLQLTEGSSPAAGGEHAFASPICAPSGSSSGFGLSCGGRF